MTFDASPICVRTMHDSVCSESVEVEFRQNFWLAKEHCFALLAQARPTMFYIYTSIVVGNKDHSTIHCILPFLITGPNLYPQNVIITGVEFQQLGELLHLMDCSFMPRILCTGEEKLSFNSHNIWKLGNFHQIYPIISESVSLT